MQARTQVINAIKLTLATYPGNRTQLRTKGRIGTPRKVRGKNALSFYVSSDDALCNREQALAMAVKLTVATGHAVTLQGGLYSGASFYVAL